MSVKYEGSVEILRTRFNNETGDWSDGPESFSYWDTRQHDSVADLKDDVKAGVEYSDWRPLEILEVSEWEAYPEQDGILMMQGSISDPDRDEPAILDVSLVVRRVTKEPVHFTHTKDVPVGSLAKNERFKSGDRWGVVLDQYSENTKVMWDKEDDEDGWKTRKKRIEYLPTGQEVEAVVEATDEG